MRTELGASLLATEHGQRANEILRSCVHCGFCNATCPTYQVTGDELDGPRGRIYLIKDLLESEQSNARVDRHLDRCLTCRACETTCPSGVRYGELLEIARESLSESRRSWWQQLLVWWMKVAIPRRALFRWFVVAGSAVRPLLPSALARQVPKVRAPSRIHSPSSVRKVVLLRGCVQDVATPDTVAALAALLERHGIESVVVPQESCCGALPLHLGDTPRALALMRRNVQALTPYLDGVEAIVSTASGCGVTVKDYGRLLDDAAAQQVAELTVDACEFVSSLSSAKTAGGTGPGRATRVAWHAPCTLQHGQGLKQLVEQLLAAAGYELVAVRDPHLCCGSAGTYSMLQPELSQQLRVRKLSSLLEGAPDVIATANVGCQEHLKGEHDVPVVHWIELLSPERSAAAGL